MFWVTNLDFSVPQRLFRIKVSNMPIYFEKIPNNLSFNSISDRFSMYFNY